MIRFDTNNYEFNKSSDIGIYIIHGFSNTTDFYLYIVTLHSQALIKDKLA